MATRILVSKKLKSEIMLCLGNADDAGATAREQHRATPETPILSPIHRAPKIEVLRLGEETGFFSKFTTFFRKIPKLSAKTARAFAGPAEAFIIPPRRL